MTAKLDEALLVSEVKKQAGEGGCHIQYRYPPIGEAKHHNEQDEVPKRENQDDGQREVDRGGKGLVFQFPSDGVGAFERNEIFDEAEKVEGESNDIQ